MRSLVIGYGSIGSRHASVLSKLKCDVSVVSSRKNERYTCFQSIELALERNHFDQIIIANPTNNHFETLNKISNCNFHGTILVEKPLFSKLEQLPNNENIYVAYNLRFHALIQKIRVLLQDEELISCSVQVGSYLPNWRKNSDYRECYSTKKEYGGGVLRDLSHEIDYILWVCGKCNEVTAVGGHYSDLEITSDDVYAILMRCERCPIINLQLDYLNKMPTRQITIHTKKNNSFFLDLIKGELSINGDLTLKAQGAISKTYMAQHELMLKKDFTDFCDYQQGLSVVKLIETIEQASFEKKWVTL